MVRCYSLEYQDVIPLYDSIHCRKCRNQVARVHDYIRMVWPQGIFARLFNVLVPESENSHLGQFGTTVVNANCIGCGELIGWKIIAVTRQNMYVREGRFFMNLDKLSLWNDVPLLHLNGLQDLGVNEENADQHGDPNEQNVDQDGDANEQNVDQDGDTNEHAPNEQGDANKQNADQDKDTNEEDVGTIQYNFTDLLMHFICQNANQGGGGGNDQVHNEQDVGTNEKSADQDGDSTDQDGDTTDGDANDQDRDATDGDTTDGDANEQNVDQDGDTNEQGVANEQNVDQDKDTNEDVGINQYNFTNLLMHFICQSANQGEGGGNEQNHDQDGGGNEQVNKEQDVGANEKSADQDGDSTDQDGDSTDQDAETTDRDGDATEMLLIEMEVLSMI